MSVRINEVDYGVAFRDIEKTKYMFEFGKTHQKETRCIELFAIMLIMSVCFCSDFSNA